MKQGEFQAVHGEEVDIVGLYHDTSTQHSRSESNINQNSPSKAIKIYKSINDHHELDDHHAIELTGLNTAAKNTTLIKQRLLPVPTYDNCDLIKAYIVEFTACFMFMIIENYSRDNVLGILCGLFILVNFLYAVAGSNMNGMVSFNLWYYEEEFSKVHTLRRFGYIFVIQPLGMLAGHLTSLGMLGDIIHLKPMTSTPFQIAFCEFIFTGFIMFSIVFCIVSRYTKSSDVLLLNLAFFFIALYSAIQCGAKVSGAVYNPTKYIVMQAVAVVRGVEPNAFQNWYCYIFPQFLGGFLFTSAFKYFHEPLYLKTMTMKKKWENKFYPKVYDD